MRRALLLSLVLLVATLVVFTGCTINRPDDSNDQDDIFGDLEDDDEFEHISEFDDDEYPEISDDEFDDEEFDEEDEDEEF